MHAKLISYDKIAEYNNSRKLCEYQIFYKEDIVEFCFVDGQERILYHLSSKSTSPFNLSKNKYVQEIAYNFFGI